MTRVFRTAGWLWVAGIVLAVGASAQAATQWNDFPPKQSRLTFDAPGLRSLPSRAQEGIVLGGKTNVRHFFYGYAAAGNGGSYAGVLVHTINADGTYFTAWPDFDTNLPGKYGDFKNKVVTWDDAVAQRADAPVGPTKYRRLTAGGRSCLAFGGLYGAAATAPFAAGFMASGSVLISGYYCAPQDYRLSAADAALVLSRLSFEDLAKAQGPQPPAFAGSGEAPAPSPSSPPSSSPASSPTPSPPATAAADEKPAVPQTAAPAAVPAAAPPGQVRRAVALIWEGHEGPVDASMVFNPHAATARLTVFLPGEPRACIGIAHTAKDNTGEWSVQCPSGAYAGGRFRFLGQKQGSMGEGRDNKGAKVAFTVAGE